MERNLCSESGCRAFCCRDAELPFPGLTFDEVRKFFPDAKRVKTVFECLPLRAIGDKNVYWDGGCITINGVCPNVENNFDCRLKNDRPEPCKEFGLGQDPCNATRLNRLLITYREWEYQKSRLSTSQESSEK